MKTKITAIHLAVGFVLFASSSATYAAETSVSGRVTYVIVSQDTTKLSNGSSVLHLHDKGILLSDDSKNPTNGAMQDCFDTVVLGADGSPGDGAGYCDLFDKDGDGYWFTWAGTLTGGDWVIYHGNGKYDGMTGSGSFTTDFMLDDRFTVTFKGKVTMK